ADGAADGLRRLGRPRAGRRGARRAAGRARRLRPPRALGARAARARGERALRVPGGVPRPLLREAPLQLRPARARRAVHLPRDGAGRRRAPTGPGAPLHPGRDPRRMTTLAASPTVAEILERVLDGERLSDDHALALLESRD